MWLTCHNSEVRFILKIFKLLEFLAIYWIQKRLKTTQLYWIALSSTQQKIHFYYILHVQNTLNNVLNNRLGKNDIAYRIIYGKLTFDNFMESQRLHLEPSLLGTCIKLSTRIKRVGLIVWLLRFLNNCLSLNLLYSHTCYHWCCPALLPSLLTHNINTCNFF